MKRIVFPICLLLACAPAWAYLRIHPDNPHYFQESTTKEAVLLAGCLAVVPTSTEFDYIAQIAEMKEKNISYTRVWHFLPWGKEDSIWPWAKSDVDGAHMGGRGGKKFDMDKWNPEYWRRMRDSMDRCNKAGVYAEIHIFDRCGMSPPDETRWGGNPWASDNNINNLEVPDSSGEGTPEFYKFAEKPNLRKQQERYVRKMIDETIAYPNVIYEIENEHWSYNNPDWAAHWYKFVKDYIAKKSPGSPRLISYSSLQNDLEAFYDRPEVDIVNRHFGAECELDPKDEGKYLLNEYIEPRWSKNKPINIDEFANAVEDPALLRRMCWIIVTSGGHYHIEDCKPESKPFDICENIRRFRVESKWDFIHSAPNKALIKSKGGYCMAQPGKEYVAYVAKGGAVRIELEPGEYTVRWWNPTTGGFTSAGWFSHPSGVKELATPDQSDWVLHAARRLKDMMSPPKRF